MRAKETKMNYGNSVSFHDHEKETFSARLEIAIGNTSVRAFASAIDMSEGALRKYLRGDSLPQIDKAALIAEHANVSLTWLATGKGSKHLDEHDSQAVCEVQKKYLTSQVVSIPYYDVSASAGNGLIPFEESNIEYTMEIHPQILLDLGVSSQNLLSMPVKGDSMEPSLFEGDIVLVNRLLKPYSILEGIYVIRIDNDIFIKHIQFNKFESKLKISSVNELYDSYHITGEDLNQVEIIGEALCKLGRIRMKPAPRIPTA